MIREIKSREEETMFMSGEDSMKSEKMITGRRIDEVRETLGHMREE